MILKQIGFLHPIPLQLAFNEWPTVSRKQPLKICEATCVAGGAMGRGRGRKDVFCWEALEGPWPPMCRNPQELIKHRGLLRGLGWAGPTLLTLSQVPRAAHPCQLMALSRNGVAQPWLYVCIAWVTLKNSVARWLQRCWFTLGWGLGIHHCCCPWCL